MCIEHAAKQPSPTTEITTRALAETTNVAKQQHLRSEHQPKRPSRTSPSTPAPPSKRSALKALKHHYHHRSSPTAAQTQAHQSPAPVHGPARDGTFAAGAAAGTSAAKKQRHDASVGHAARKPHKSGVVSPCTSSTPSPSPTNCHPGIGSGNRGTPSIPKPTVNNQQDGRSPDDKCCTTTPSKHNSAATATAGPPATSSPHTPKQQQQHSTNVPTNNKTTAILDWDDTICPSTHLASLGLRVDDASALPAPLQRQLEALECAVINIVEEALRFGNVVVITNAEAGWVELSGRRFLPRVVAFLVKHGIKIVSARSSFESDFPDAPSSWKMAAFSQEVAVMFPDEDHLNLLVLGDSMSERDAAHALSTRLPNSRVKTVKFVERPSIDQLMRQVQLVAQSLPDLASYASSFDVDLVVSASG